MNFAIMLASFVVLFIACIIIIYKTLKSSKMKPLIEKHTCGCEFKKNGIPIWIFCKEAQKLQLEMANGGPKEKAAYDAHFEKNRIGERAFPNDFMYNRNTKKYNINQ